MSVLRSVTAAGLIALSLAGATVATATVADASPRDAFSHAVRTANPANGVYEVRYFHRHCRWEVRRDRWGHRHRVQVCTR